MFTTDAVNLKSKMFSFYDQWLLILLYAYDCLFKLITPNCRYGQFDSAKETFEVIADIESLLDLFICHLNPSAMRRLAQKLEEEGTDSELRRYCERILRVRSTGWTQGIFANFAAESVVPKGPEWGGGNWEIKTPTNMKDIPQWELAAEVMPYMKTDDGSIPSIIADHIGVYLGSIKGRGNIIEVREDSLVKPFTPAGGNIKENGVPISLAKPVSNMSKEVPASNSLMGLETLSKQASGSTSADEQAKAAEEFKKSLYGASADGSSSDEEGVSKPKKLQIRIRDKPVTSAALDVNKIKEATKQFKLGEGFGPPMSRTKSLPGGPQDIGMILSQPTPPTTGTVMAPTSSTPVDPFGTETLIQPAQVSQPGPLLIGTGVASAPIPEDFFQNTVSSLQVAASLRPAGSYLAQYQGIEGNKATPNQVNAPAADVGLPDGGVPPQATQQSVISLESIGLPDGGVPPQAIGPTAGLPQSMGQAAVLPQSVSQAAQVPVSTQPLDLSVLGVPGSTNSGDPPARPTSPPASVRSGQVSIFPFFSYFFLFSGWFFYYFTLFFTFLFLFFCHKFLVSEI